MITGEVVVIEKQRYKALCRAASPADLLDEWAWDSRGVMLARKLLDSRIARALEPFTMKRLSPQEREETVKLIIITSGEFVEELMEKGRGILDGP